MSPHVAVMVRYSTHGCSARWYCTVRNSSEGVHGAGFVFLIFWFYSITQATQQKDAKGASVTRTQRMKYVKQTRGTDVVCVRANVSQRCQLPSPLGSASDVAARVQNEGYVGAFDAVCASPICCVLSLWSMVEHLVVTCFSV